MLLAEDNEVNALVVEAMLERIGCQVIKVDNGDDAVRTLKGADRPINNEQDRAIVLAALESVGAVCIFAEATATRFLAHAEPDVYVKGGDYTLETLNQDERRTVEKSGGKIVIIPFVPGKSTTATLAKIARL